MLSQPQQPDRDEHGSGLDRTAIFLKIGGQDWMGLRKYFLF